MKIGVRPRFLIPRRVKARHNSGAFAGTLALGVLALALMGCEQTPEKPVSEAPPVNLSGYSKPFRDGFKDGCDSARGKHARRNEKRYGADPQYARGWDDGHAICQRR